MAAAPVAPDPSSQHPKTWPKRSPPGPTARVKGPGFRELHGGVSVKLAQLSTSEQPTGQCSERAGGWDNGEPAGMQEGINPSCTFSSQDSLLSPPIPSFSFQIAGAAPKRVCLTSQSEFPYRKIKNTS